MIAAVPVIAVLGGDIPRSTLCAAPEGAASTESRGRSSNVDLGSACEELGAATKYQSFPSDICFHTKDRHAQPASPSVCSPEKTGFCDYESLLGSLRAGLGNTFLKTFFILCFSKVGVRSK